MAFTTPSYDLIDLFHRIERGDLQLPDFQRSYVWDVDRIRSLLVTVLRGHPIGAFMALDTRNVPLKFRPRPLEGAPTDNVEPGLLLLDGQQRLTTLYQTLCGDGIVNSVDFRKKRARRQYFVDVEKAVSGEFMPDEAVIAVDDKGVVKSHFGPQLAEGLASREQALAAGCLPISALLSDEGTDMLFELYERTDSAGKERIRRFQNSIVKPLIRYNVPLIRLDRETAQGGIGAIFAQANSSGVQMDVFELLTAVFAAEDPDFHLRDDWAKTEPILRKFPALDGITKTHFLQAVALYVTAKQGKALAHREAILQLKLEEYKPAAETMRAAFHEAANYMRTRCMLTTNSVPYTEQLIPLTVIIALLADEPGVLSKKESWDRLNRWFWCGVFGELYGAPALTLRMGHDVDEVTAWIRAVEKGEEALPHDEAGNVYATPKTVREARFVESRLLSANAQSGLYKGIYALLMGRGARDWATGVALDRETAPQLGVHFRAIFPKRWCEEHNVPDVLADSVLNRTPMGRRTYVLVEESSPARYLYRVQAKSLLDDPEFDEVLETHLICPPLLLAAKADEFFADRRKRFLTMIEEAMGTAAIEDVDDANLGGGEEGPDAFLLEEV